MRVRIYDSKLWVSRLIWLVMALLTLYLFFLDFPIRLDSYQTVCDSPNNGCLETSQLTVKEVIQLEEMGLSLKAYTGFKIALDLIEALVFYVISGLLLFRKESMVFNLYVAMVFISLGAGISFSFPEQFPEWTFFYHIISIFGGTYLVLFLVLPDGKFVPSWSLLAALLWIVVGAGTVYLPGSFIDLETWPIWTSIVTWVTLHLILVFSQTYRYVKKSDQIQRQQMKWYLYSIAMYFIALLSLNFIGQLGVTLKFATELFYTASSILIPISIGFAIFKYKLWDINIVIHRTILYGALSLFVILFYVLMVGLLSRFFQSEDNLLASIITAGIIAVCFQPLKERLQSIVNRLIFGDRDNPYKILNQLNSILEVSRSTDHVLPLVVKTLSQALKIPYAAVQLNERGSDQIVASFGEAREVGVEIPLLYQGQQLGTLLLSHRSSAEPFSQADLKVLHDMARQVGIVAHSILLYKDLQWSREKLVNAREEERRRLRRDLHDGLGPSLASLAIKIDVAQTIMNKEPFKSQKLLIEMDSQIKQLIQDIRRLVYSLRPSTLDELGLLSAIRELTSHYKMGPIHFIVKGPESFPPLPAAVEVAVYRIVQEAITNVVRHSGAKKCIIDITLNEKLLLSVIDDGLGLSHSLLFGIGIKSMKERAEELGGSFSVYSPTAGGTEILAELPI
ncbi:histidine kinase [Bacillus oleivorans]|uniref:histidine kinase n=1 Tax=Bacillus oleivorans TaxID=1448271 RepID=A0A285CYM1_9BACI|nr:GAF domain-containing sensor histidine kinase [Bacillus oleivorans]SNX72652.1 histidine kinase [Bacillus oleivorans]